MKSLSRYVAAVAVALIALPGAAQKRGVEVMQPIAMEAAATRAPRTVGDIVASVNAGRRPSVIEIDLASESFIIPVAGNTPGSGGTYFKSDVAFNNDRLAEQRIAVGWLAQGQNNCDEPLTYFLLAANSVTVADDFVAQSLGKTGIGALIVLAVKSDGAADSAGEIDGYSRIWTPQPGVANGTVSQNFSAVSLTDSFGSLPATLMGLKQSSRFRTNVGVVNLDNFSHNWTFTSVFSGAASTLTVPPCSVVQAGAPAGSGSASGNVAFTVRSDGVGSYWSAFGSSTDNTTGDGWVARAIQ